MVGIPSYNTGLEQYMSILRRIACQHRLSSFIVRKRKRKIVQFWLVLLDKMFFHNLSEILTLLFYLVEGGDKNVLFLPQIEMCWLMPNILNSFWAICCLWTLALLLTVSPVWPIYFELQPLMQYIKLLDLQFISAVILMHCPHQILLMRFL